MVVAHSTVQTVHRCSHMDPHSSQHAPPAIRKHVSCNVHCDKTCSCAGWTSCAIVVDGYLSGARNGCGACFAALCRDWRRLRALRLSSQRRHFGRHEFTAPRETSISAVSKCEFANAMCKAVCPTRSSAIQCRMRTSRRAQRRQQSQHATAQSGCAAQSRFVPRRRAQRHQ